MLAFARHEATLNRPAEEGSRFTVRAHLEAAAARGIAAAARELEGPELPEPLEYLWTWFQELDATREYDGASGHPKAFTYPMIEAWARLTGRTPTPEEVSTLLALDVATRFPEAVPAEEGADG